MHVSLTCDTLFYFLTVIASRQTEERSNCIREKRFVHTVRIDFERYGGGGGGACQSTVTSERFLPTYFAVLAIFAQFYHEEFALNLAVAYILSEFLYIYKRACIVGNFFCLELQIFE
jgi:hypothetical protein